MSGDPPKISRLTKSPLTVVRPQAPVHQTGMTLLDFELAVAATVPAVGREEDLDQPRHRAPMLLFSVADTFTVTSFTPFTWDLTASRDFET